MAIPATPNETLDWSRIDVKARAFISLRRTPSKQHAVTSINYCFWSEVSGDLVTDLFVKLTDTYKLLDASSPPPYHFEKEIHMRFPFYSMLVASHVIFIINHC